MERPALRLNNRSTNDGHHMTKPQEQQGWLDTNTLSVKQRGFDPILAYRRVTLYIYMYIYFCNFTSPMHERTINVINPVPTGTLFVRCCSYIRFSLTRRKMNTNLERTEKGNEKEETAPTGNSLVATCEIFSCACDAYATFCACATFCAS